MISYLKLYGPPVYEALKALEKIAVGMPEVCIMSQMYTVSIPNPSTSPEMAYNYFSDLLSVDVDRDRCDTIISKSGERLGEYDFFFEWFKDPTMDELNDLIRRIDEALKPLGTRYTITTR